MGLQWRIWFIERCDSNKVKPHVRTRAAAGGNKSLEKMIDKGISGDMILEVPVQKNKVPQTILDFAKSENIVIRDILGNIYK